jgi:hypothetical protein
VPLEVENRPLRDALELQRLVQAVLAANDEDETFFLEWKSSLDLKGKDDIYAIARCILGLANRHPDLAATRMGGLGYLVIGAAGGAGGAPAGIPRMDEVDLANKLSSYLGDEHPMWTASWTQVDGADVLVITVEPPKWGDPIWLLWSDYQDPKKRLVAQGTVFTRDGTKTKPAKAAQHKMLQERLRRGVGDAPTIEVSVEIEHDGFERWDLSEEGQADWLTIAPIRIETQVDVVTQAGMELLQEWVGKAAERLGDVARNSFIGNFENLLSITLRNPSTVNLSDIELLIRIPGAAESLVIFSDERDFYKKLPPLPDLTAEHAGMARLSRGFSGEDMELEPIQKIRPLSRIGVEPDSDDYLISLSVGHLRPLGTTWCPRIYVVPGRDAPSQFDCTYMLTSTTVNAVQPGSFVLPIDNAFHRMSEMVPFPKVRSTR